MNARELVLKTMNNEKVERVPCGFWHHFITGRDQFIGLEEPEVLERAFKGHIDYYCKVQPDLMKLMSEGFFAYPQIMNNPLESAEDLLRVRPIGRQHPWIIKQLDHVERMVEQLKEEVLCYYNIFSPLQIMRIKFDFLDLNYGKFIYLAEHFPEAMRSAGLAIMEDLMILVEKLFSSSGIDGIYYCVQNVQSPLYDDERYQEIFSVSELPVLSLANSLADTNILHICGYSHYTNRFSTFQNYPAKIYNWASHTEMISLQQGKEYFNGACVLGGFDNNPNTLIDQGSPEELRAYVAKLIQENGFQGYIIGADCSIPNDIDDNQVRIIRDACHEFNNSTDWQ